MFTAVVITVSDKGYLGEREDVSGKVAINILEKNGYLINEYKILPDQKELISEELKRLCDTGTDLIITTGGTGFSVKDVTPEATLDVIERQAYGISQAMIFNSMNITPRAMLTRGIAGIRDKTLIINLPGSPKAVKENLEFVIISIGHGIEILKGTTSECGNQ